MKLTPSAPREHLLAVGAYPDALIQSSIDDLGGRNLSNIRDHEIRWMADRSKALRQVRRERKTAGTWSIPKRQPATR
jgi:hypothetical protein